MFGMELLCKLPLAPTNQFFATFFKLPGFYWRGFLASRLSSVQLIAFAMLMLLLAPPAIKVPACTPSPTLLPHPAETTQWSPTCCRVCSSK